MLKKNIQTQKGQVLVLSVILLPLLLIMTILIIEVGFLYIKQSQLQSAANAIALDEIKDEDKVNELIKANRTVDLDVVSFTQTDDTGKFKVELEEPVKPIFGKIFGTGEITRIKVYSAAVNNKLVPWN